MSPSYEIKVDSKGRPEQFATYDDLCARLNALPLAPRDIGTLSLINRKIRRNLRHVPGQIHLTPEEGIPGDAWGADSNPDPDAQLAVMQTDVAKLIANGQPLELFGDNLYLDLDLSAANLPTGSRLRLGRSVVEVTPKPHNGCSIFRARFGADAHRFVSDPILRPQNLRGIYLRVIEGGEIAVGDAVQVIFRDPAEKAGV